MPRRQYNHEKTIQKNKQKIEENTQRIYEKDKEHRYKTKSNRAAEHKLPITPYQLLTAIAFAGLIASASAEPLRPSRKERRKEDLSPDKLTGSVSTSRLSSFSQKIKENPPEISFPTDNARPDNNVEILRDIEYLKTSKHITHFLGNTLEEQKDPQAICFKRLFKHVKKNPALILKLDTENLLIRCAVKFNFLKELEFLIENGWDIHNQYDYQTNFAELALFKNNFEMLEIFASKGLYLDLKDKEKRKFFELILNENSFQKKLLDKKAEIPLFIEFLEKQDLYPKIKKESVVYYASFAALTAILIMSRKVIKDLFAKYFQPKASPQTSALTLSASSNSKKIVRLPYNKPDRISVQVKEIIGQWDKISKQEKTIIYELEQYQNSFNKCNEKLNEIQTELSQQPEINNMHKKIRDIVSTKPLSLDDFKSLLERIEKISLLILTIECDSRKVKLGNLKEIAKSLDALQKDIESQNFPERLQSRNELITHYNHNHEAWFKSDALKKRKKTSNAPSKTYTSVKTSVPESKQQNKNKIDSRKNPLNNIDNIQVKSKNVSVAAAAIIQTSPTPQTIQTISATPPSPLPSMSQTQTTRTTQPTQTLPSFNKHYFFPALLSQETGKKNSEFYTPAPVPFPYKTTTSGSLSQKNQITQTTTTTTPTTQTFALFPRQHAFPKPSAEQACKLAMEYYLALCAHLEEDNNYSNNYRLALAYYICRLFNSLLEMYENGSSSSQQESFKKTLKNFRHQLTKGIFKVELDEIKNAANVLRKNFEPVYQSYLLKKLDHAQIQTCCEEVQQTNFSKTLNFNWHNLEEKDLPEENINQLLFYLEQINGENTITIASYTPDYMPAMKMLIMAASQYYEKNLKAHFKNHIEISSFFNQLRRLRNTIAHHAASFEEVSERQLSQIKEKIPLIITTFENHLKLNKNLPDPQIFEENIIYQGVYNAQ